VISVQHKIAQSFKWNTFEAITYQLLLFAHQIALFKTVPIATYGLIGTAFAMSYFIASFVSGGFENAITPFFAQAALDQKSYRQLIVRPLLKHIMCAIFILGFALMIVKYVAYSHALTCHSMYIASLALIEGVRKILKTLVQLAFKARYSAYVEIALLGCYLATAWGACLYTGIFSIPNLFTPLIATSLLATLLYIHVIHSWYFQLPRGDNETILQPINFNKSRLLNFINQAGHNLFSSNFLVPWIAAQAGFSAAGIFKLLSHACYLITPVVQKIFGLNSQLLFAHVQHATLDEKVALLIKLNKKLFLVLAILTTLVILNIKTILATNTSLMTDSIPWFSSIVFIMLLLSENLVVVYEKFCIAQERVHFLIIYAALSFAGFYAIIFMAPTSIIAMLLALFAVRLTAFGILVMLMLRTWNIYVFYRRKTIQS